MIAKHQQQCRSNIVECYNVECCFDIVASVDRSSAYVVGVDGVQQHDGVAAFFDHHAPEVGDGFSERQLRQYVRQRRVKALSQHGIITHMHV